MLFRSNSKENLDAWNISFTKAQTVGIWLGNLDNKPIQYAGGNQPTQIVKRYFEIIPDDSKFDIPNSIVEKRIDALTLDEDHIVSLANSFTPDRYTQTEIFSNFNLPSDISNKFATVEKAKVSSHVEKGMAILEIEAKDYESYDIIVNGQIVNQIVGKNGKQKLSIPLSTAKQDIIVENYYTLTPENKESQQLSFVKKEKQTKNSKWYI